MNIKDKIKIIHASGTELLTEKQKQLINRLLNEYYKRIQRQLKNQVSIEFHVKTYEHADKGGGRVNEFARVSREGGRVSNNEQTRESGTNAPIKNKKQKYSIHARVDSSLKPIEADYADWELERATHIVMNKLMNEIEHALHSSDQHDKVRRLQQKRRK